VDKVKSRTVNLSRKTFECPKCGLRCNRHSSGSRKLKEVGTSGPVILVVKYSKHYCIDCKRHFSLPMDHLAKPYGRFTNRVRRLAVDLIIKDSMTLEKASLFMKKKYFVDVPMTTIHDWIVTDTM
jgi:transposase